MTAALRTTRFGRTLILVLALAAAGLVAVRWAGQDGASDGSIDRRDIPGAQVTGAAPANAPAAPGPSAVAAQAKTAGPGGVSPSGRGAVVRGKASAGREAYEHAHSLAGLFNTLHRQSDPDAQFFALRALRDCLPFVRAAVQPGEPPALDRYRPAPPGDAMTVRRQAAYGGLQARCSGFDLGDDAQTAARLLRDALVSSNDSRATLEQMALDVRRGAEPQAAMDKARELSAGGDPYMLEQASALMSAMRGKYVFMLDGELVRPDIVAAGWMMAACDAGRDCGAQWVEAPCAFLTECDARDLESSLARYQLTPAEFDRMQQVRARVTQGVTTGQWDATLFTPQAQPPWYRRWGP